MPFSPGIVRWWIVRAGGWSTETVPAAGALLRRGSGLRLPPDSRTRSRLLYVQDREVAEERRAAQLVMEQRNVVVGDCVPAQGDRSRALGVIAQPDARRDDGGYLVEHLHGAQGLLPRAIEHRELLLDGADLSRIGRSRRDLLVESR